MTYIIASHLTLVACLIALGAQMLWLHRQGTNKHYAQTKDQMREHIVWKLFYVNPEDPRAWVPKLWGPGYTVNFRNIRNALVFSSIIVLTMLSAFWTSWTALAAAFI